MSWAPSSSRRSVIALTVLGLLLCIGGGAWRVWMRLSGRLDPEAATKLASEWTRTFDVKDSGLVARIPDTPAWSCSRLQYGCDAGRHMLATWAIDREERTESIDTLIDGAPTPGEGVIPSLSIKYEVAGFRGYLMRWPGEDGTFTRYMFRGWREAPPADGPVPPHMEALGGLLTLVLRAEASGEPRPLEPLAAMLSVRVGPAGIPKTRPGGHDRWILDEADRKYGELLRCTSPRMCSLFAWKAVDPDPSPEVDEPEERAHRHAIVCASLNARTPPFRELLTSHLREAIGGGTLEDMYMAELFASSLAACDPANDPWKDLAPSVARGCAAHPRDDESERWLTFGARVADWRAARGEREAIDDFAACVERVDPQIVLHAPEWPLRTLGSEHAGPRTRALLTRLFDPRRTPPADDTDWSQIARFAAGRVFKDAAMRAHVLAGLRDTRPWATLTRDRSGLHEESPSLWKHEHAEAGPTPPEVQKAYERVCDAYASSLKSAGMPPFDLFADPEVRDEQIRAVVEFIAAHGAP